MRPALGPCQSVRPPTAQFVGASTAELQAWQPSDFKSERGSSGIPYYAPATSEQCRRDARPQAVGSRRRHSSVQSTASLNMFGCYANGSSVMMPPPLGQFGNMSRNMFQDTGFKNFDFSLAKNFHFGETMRLQGRIEFFNILNHPNFANPYGGQNGFGLNDPSVQSFWLRLRHAGYRCRQPCRGLGRPALYPDRSEIRVLAVRPVSRE